MKIVLAPDKYKGSLSGLEFCNIVAPILKQTVNAEVINVPLADGGDGTLQTLVDITEGELIKQKVWI